MSNPAQHDTIDLSASAARIRSARSLAAAQSRQVAAALEGADKQSIDLLFLLQENVLVMTETHLLLEQLAGMEARRTQTAKRVSPVTQLPVAARRRLPARRAMSSAVLLVLAFIASAWVLEVLDPASMDVEASIFRFLRPHL